MIFLWDRKEINVHIIDDNFTGRDFQDPGSDVCLPEDF